MRNCYLTGLDWLMHAVERSSRRCSRAGNSFQIVLELEKHLDVSKLGAALNELADSIPFLSGCVSRHWTWEPRWRISSRLKGRTVRFESFQCTASEVPGLLQHYTNLPMLTDHEYITFRYHELTEGDSILSATFDHRVFDAKGGEMFLSKLARYMSGEESLESVASSLEPLKPTLLNRWRERFESGRYVIRHLLKISDCEAYALDVDLTCRQTISPLIVKLDKEQTTLFDKRVSRDAGFMMFMPYALSMAARIFHSVFGLRDSGKSYIVPCTTDVRGAEKDYSKTFLNHCSMMFFRVDSSQLDDQNKSLPSIIKDQFYNQCKADIPKHLERALVLMRVMPISVFTWVMCKKMTKFFVPFSFAFSSFVSEFSGQNNFCGVAINNLYHMPRIPPQVGVGFFFNKFDEHLNAIVMCYDSVVDEDKRSEIYSLLRCAMLDSR